MRKMPVLGAFCLFPLAAWAASGVKADVSYIEETEALGAVAGQGMFCKAPTLERFEVLARAIILTKASSDEMQERGVRTYNNKKADAYISKQMDGGFDCPNVVRRFDNQGIFDIKLHADGTLQMPNGTIFTPRRAYDASLLK